MGVRRRRQRNWGYVVSLVAFFLCIAAPFLGYGLHALLEPPPSEGHVGTDEDTTILASLFSTALFMVLMAGTSVVALIVGWVDERSRRRRPPAARDDAARRRDPRPAGPTPSSFFRDPRQGP